ncbi:unnamed protein product [Caenorhabditis bovis]|uniref:long-chain-fatty-acid--CoA ligase n=1 Tax=Caenorhabditis bovis TaxID=2654633 RepID=A0A8S1EZJ4_9PELO|nr:unnamed protein product [Caenorhabditis bovis]
MLIPRSIGVLMRATSKVLLSVRTSSTKKPSKFNDLNSFCSGKSEIEVGDYLDATHRHSIQHNMLVTSRILLAAGVVARRSTTASRRTLFWTRKIAPRCDLNNQTIVLEDGSRKAAWLGDRDIMRTSDDGILTVYSAYRNGMKLGAKDMLGLRRGETLDWKFISYERAFELADQIGKSLRILGIPTGDETRIGIYSKNRPEWVMSEIAIHNYSNVTIPFYDTISVDDMIYIANLTEIPVVFTDSEDKTRMLLQNKSKIRNLKHIIQFNDVSDDVRSLAKNENVDVFHFDEFRRLGKHEHLPHLVPTPETIATISFTSGTTGRPKGVILTHGNMCAVLTSSFDFKFDVGDSNLSYLPLAHIYERGCTLITLTRGGRIGFFRGEPQHILEDVQSLKPAMFATVPRVIDKIYKAIMYELRYSPIKKLVLKLAVKYKNLKYAKTGVIDRDSWVDKLILAKIQAILGPNLKNMVVGAAKSDPHKMEFVRGAFGVNLFEGFGQTETSGIVSIQIAGDSTPGVVGIPAACNVVKLRDVPDLGYYADKNGGEMLVKGYNITQGYFKNEAATREAFTDDGFLKTGDIARWTPQGSLEIVDRAKNVFKMAQGKFVAPEDIESTYTASRFVSQIYVHGDITKAHLVAIVVPDPLHLRNYAETKYQISDQSFEELCRNEKIREDVLRHLVRITEFHRRPRYEGVYGVHLTPNAFTVENGLTTPTMKNKRARIAKHFEREIARMYDEIEANEMSK